LAITATSELFAQAEVTPAVQSLARRVENGGVLSFEGITEAALPFLTALLHSWFPERPILVVVEGLKTQESFHQDLTTWLNLANRSNDERPTGSAEQSSATMRPCPPGRTSTEAGKHIEPLFYPAWEILPHEGKLPHADVISERLETLVALQESSGQQKRPKIVVASVAALLQRTFPRKILTQNTRTLNRGERIAPLDLVDWLEQQGYEPEAQVSQKGELAVRGGILDVY